MRLKDQIRTLAKTIYKQFKEKLEKFDGDLIAFNKNLPPMLREVLDIPYKEQFRLSSDQKLLNTFVASKDTSVMERRITNVLISIFKSQDHIYLDEILKLVSEKDENNTIVGIEELIKKKILEVKPK